MERFATFIWRTCWSEVSRLEKAIDLGTLAGPPVIQYLLENKWIANVDPPWWAWVAGSLFFLVCIIALACTRKAYQLEKDRAPVLRASFTPKGCVASGGLSGDGSNATYIRVYVQAETGDRVTDVTPILARIERFDGATRSFELIGSGDPLALVWAAEGGKAFAPGTVLRKVGRYIDVLHAHESENNYLHLDTQTKLFHLQREIQKPGTYRLTIIVDPQIGPTADVTIEVNWDGTWNGLKAYTAPTPDLA